MLKTKNGELKALTTSQFAEEILDNPNKVFCFLPKPGDDYCFFLASVNLFGTQTILINGARILGGGTIGIPGYSHAFSITCYDAAWKLCYEREECLKEIENGLDCFDGTQGTGNETWYVVEGDKVRTMKIICL